MHKVRQANRQDELGKAEKDGEGQEAVEEMGEGEYGCRGMQKKGRRQLRTVVRGCRETSFGFSFCCM